MKVCSLRASTASGAKASATASAVWYPTDRDATARVKAGWASLIQIVLSTSRANSRSAGRDSNCTRRPYLAGRRRPATVDGRQLTRAETPASDSVSIAIRLGRRRTPSAIGFIERHQAPVPDHRQGVAISTFGKIIKRGWDWLGLAPAASAHISGLIEASDLAACLTLSKNDFIRTGTRGSRHDLGEDGLFERAGVRVAKILEEVLEVDPCFAHGGILLGALCGSQREFCTRWREPHNGLDRCVASGL